MKKQVLNEAIYQEMLVKDYLIHYRKEYPYGARA
jgi:hypothetical protein